ncbi:M20 family metallopeptidase [Phreatobacter aquaticus]|nr:ArgE/DapE family deacylase [Phreatobacter aquaticus]
MTNAPAAPSPALLDALDKAIAADRDHLVDLLSRLVQMPSVNPKFLRDPQWNREPEVQDIIEAELQGLGFMTERSFPLPDRPNLIGRWAGSDARSLAVCGHVDVVPQGDLAGWTVDPFGAEVRGDKLYGRGSCDMKAGLAAALVACRAISRLGLTLDGRLEFHAVVDEEAGGFGAMAAAALRPAPAGVLICEPSAGAIRPWAGGLEWVRVTLRGLSGHSARRFASIYPSEAAASVPVKSVNAIELGARLLASLRELETQWGIAKSFPGMPAGMNTISPGVMVSGCGMGPDGLPTILSNPAMVPDLCVIDFDMKFLPNETSADIRREFEEWVARFAAADPWLRDHPPEIRWELADLHFPPVNTPLEHGLVQAVKASVEARGRAPEIVGSLGVTDAAHYAAEGIPGVVYGPTGAAQHGPDEYVLISSVIETAQVVAQSIVRFCGVRAAAS